MATRKSSFGGLTKPRPIGSWSFSRYRDYRKCPRLFKHKYVDRMKEPPNKAMERGTEIHKLAEDYLLGKLKKLPAELEKFEVEFNALRAMKPETETGLYFTKEWKLTTFDDWNNCWLRIKIDARATREEGPRLVVDHKTGRVKDEDREQMSLYALGEFKADPALEVVETELWYIDHGEIMDDRYVRKQLPVLEKDWAKKTKAMLSDTTYKPTPGRACDYCIYSKAKGGPCAY